MDIQTSVLRINQLHVSLTTQQYRREIIHDLNFEIKRGKVFGLVGGSGSGKTVACMSILNLRDTDFNVKGSIHLCDQELLALNEADMQRIRGKQIAFVMQNPMSAFNPVMTIGEHFVETIQTHLRLSKSDAREFSRVHLQKMGLPYVDKLLRQYPFQLSGGMLQRVMIAMAVCLNPVLMIADEPTTALDTAYQLEILEQLNIMREQYGTSILLVSHDFGIIAQLADEVGVMANGYMIERAPVNEIFDHPMHPYTQALMEAKQGFEGMYQIDSPYGTNNSHETENSDFVEIRKGHWVRNVWEEKVRVSNQ